MFEPIETDRLVVRGTEIGDVDALHRRRNHPDAARYQDWELPFSLEAARSLVAGAAGVDHPIVGDWWMVTIVERATGAIIGDVAFRLESGGRAATVGYTLHPDHWGRGYATEAVGALIDRLIEIGVRRVSASIDPENIASARLLERLGFRYEGRLVGSWFQGPETDAPAGDDILFGLTAEARSAWLVRPTNPPAEVTLTPIDRANYRTVEALEVHWSQRDLVAPVEGSFADALFPPTRDGRLVEPWLRAIEADEGQGEGPRPVGFVMLAGLDEPDEPYLWRFLIDRAHQGRGIGARALDQIEGDLRQQGHRSIRVNWVDGVPGSPGGFYRQRGYEPTGRVSDGETEGRKHLDGPTSSPNPRPTAHARARLHHTHLFASDLDASLDFYRRWFGAEVLDDQVFAGARNVLVRLGDGRLNFYDQPPRDRGRNAIHHLGIQTEDLADLVERMADGGVEFRKPIADVGELSYVMVEGPDGVLIELFEADPNRFEGGARTWFGWA